MKKKIAALLTAFILVFTPTAAEAHGWNLYQGNDWIHVGSEHENLWIHDKECDGNRVYAWMRLRDGSLVFNWDRNGCDPGGTETTIPNDSTRFQLCEERQSGDLCTTWRDY